MNWTDEKTKQLQELHAQGKNSTQIIAIMGDGITKGMILGKLKRLRKEPEPIFKKKHHAAKEKAQPYVGYVGLAELGPRSCRWPVGDKFCGCLIEKGRYHPFCPEHQKKAIRKG